MLTIEEKIILIKELCEKHEITSYEFGDKAEISQMSAYNILNGKNLKPKNKTLNVMLDYIEKKIVGTKYKEGETLKIIEETPENYNHINLEDVIFNKIYSRLKVKLNDSEKRILAIENKIKTLLQENKTLLKIKEDDKNQQNS